MKRQVAVQIAGQRYVLKTDTDEASVKALAGYVDGRIREVQRTSRTVDTQSLAVLAALQIAEELFSERKAGSELRRKVRDRTQALLEFLEKRARL